MFKIHDNCHSVRKTQNNQNNFIMRRAIIMPNFMNIKATLCLPCAAFGDSYACPQNLNRFLKYETPHIQKMQKNPTLNIFFLYVWRATI